MKSFTRFVAALSLAACNWAAQAATLSVNLSADFTLAPLSPDPGTLSLSFSVNEPLTGVVPQFDYAFILNNRPVDAVFNGSAATSLINTIGWFDCSSSSLCGGSTGMGIDIRLDNLLVPGDRMQMILLTPVSPYIGGNVTPTLERLNLSGLSGAICYYGFGSGACTASGPMSNGLYSVTAVPEPGTWALWLAGLSAGTLLARRRMRGA